MHRIHRAARRTATWLLAVWLVAGGLVTIDARAAAADVVPGAAPATSYPAPVADFGHFDSFPEMVGSYRRMEVTAYAPDMADFSIFYGSRTVGLDSTVTMFFYPHGHATLEEQLRDEELQVLNAHPGARVLERRRITLTNGQADREATLVTFAFKMARRGEREVPVASQLLLVFRDKGIFMVRSTGPEAQGPAAEAAMLDLVQSVDWESVPGR